MEIYEYGNPNANIVLIQPVANHDMSYTGNEAEAIKALSLSETDLENTKYFKTYKNCIK